MLEILIIDDNIDKIHKIIEALLSTPVINRNNIDIVQDLQNATKSLKQKLYDIMILDIQIPRRDKEEPLMDGGIKFLEYIQLDDTFNLPLSIIGLTAFDESLVACGEFFQDHLWSIIKFDETTNEWVKKIKNKIDYFINYKDSSKHFDDLYNYDLGVVCALYKIELESILRLAKSWDEVAFPHDSTKYFTTMLEIKGKCIKIVASSAPQMGMPATAVLTTKLISHFKPRYLAMTGIAAGISGRNINLGDILVADPSWDYGSAAMGRRNL